ncbi:unnamed protein product [Orchesella dallaii]|uniref:Uncharacterized protein n=1 Tax=Orchesella dallaii TaxID=48710 RepID=A0ABP1R149_9HEXA
MGRPFCNPCPCTSLETGVKIFAVLEIVGSIIGLIGSSILVHAIDNPGTVGSTIEEQAKEVGRGAFISLIVSDILYIFLSIALFYWGAIKKKMDICWFFVGFTAGNIILTGIYLIIGLAGSGNLEQNSILIINSVLKIIIEGYIMWVIYSFIMQVRQQQEQSQLLAAAPGAFGGETGGMLEGSIYRAVDEGNYYSAEQPDYPTLVDQSQPTSAHATV